MNLPEYNYPEVKAVFMETDTPEQYPDLENTSKENVERHEEKEILFVIDGNFGFRLGDKLFRASTGTAFLIDSWIAHSFGYMPRPERQIQLWIHFRPKHIFTCIVHVQPGSTQHEWCSQELPPELLDLLNHRWNILRMQNYSHDDSMMIRQSIIRIILEELRFQRIRKIYYGGAHINPVEFIKNHIESHYGRYSSMAELERISGYNRSYITRFFHTATGFSIRNYITQVRLGFITTAMAKGISQKEIAYQLGFSSASAFSRWKKKVMNVDKTNP